MNKHTFLHLCNHKEKISTSEGSVRHLNVSNTGRLIDVIVSKAVILDILEVRVLEYDPTSHIDVLYYDNDKKRQIYDELEPTTGVYDDDGEFLVNYEKHFKDEGAAESEPLPKSYYEAYLHNRIKWSVRPPSRYRVKVLMRPTETLYREYVLDDCPRCQGKGWYTDILNNDGEFSYARGPHRIAQDVVKMLLTKLGSSVIDTTHGTTIHSQALSSKGEVEMFNDIRLIVSGVEDDYLLKQSSNMENLEPNETLVALRAEDVFLSNQGKRVVVQLSIFTIESEETLRISM